MHKLNHTTGPYVEVRDVVLQQHLHVSNTLLCTDKGERDHSLCQQHKDNTTDTLVLDTE